MIRSRYGVVKVPLVRSWIGGIALVVDLILVLSFSDLIHSMQPFGMGFSFVHIHYVQVNCLIKTCLKWSCNTRNYKYPLLSFMNSTIKWREMGNGWSGEKE